MNQEKDKISGGRLAIACLISAVTALVNPVVMMMGAFTGGMMVVLSTVILVWLFGFGGRKAYVAGALIQVLGGIVLIGGSYTLIVLCASIIPSLVMVRGMSRSVDFSTQLRSAITVTCIGTITAALIASLMAGGNVVDWLYSLIVASIEEMPEVYRTMLSESFQSVSGATQDAEEALRTVTGTLSILKTQSKVYFPAALFSGGIITAVFDVTLVNRMRAKRGVGGKGCYLPMAKWYLPGGMTAGLLLILALSYALYSFGISNGEAAFFVVLAISECAFCCSALGVFARAAAKRQVRRGWRIAGVVLLIAAFVLGGALYLAMFGLGAALFGSHGMMAQWKKKKEKQDSDESDDE